MKERKQIEHDDCKHCQAGTRHDVHEMPTTAERGYVCKKCAPTFEMLAMSFHKIADIIHEMKSYNARVEVLPFNEIGGHLFNPAHNILVINGVPVIGFEPEFATAQMIEEALKGES